MRRLIFLVPLLFAACWPFGGKGEGTDPNAVVLCVRNELTGYGNVIARGGLTRIDVLPGQTVCRQLALPGPNATLTAVTTAGGSNGSLAFREDLPSTLPGCWLWQIGPGRADPLTPTDCDQLPSARNALPPTPETHLATLPGVRPFG